MTANEPYIELAERLNALTPGDHDKKTMFANSGAEAVENAVKIARKRDRPQRRSSRSTTRSTGGRCWRCR